MTETHPDDPTRWTVLPYTDGVDMIVSPWTLDSDLADQAREYAHIYGNELEDLLHTFRDDLRGLAVDTATDRKLIESVLAAGVADLVNGNETDEQLDAIVTIAEAGHGAKIPGLRDELSKLRRLLGTAPENVRLAQELVREGVIVQPVERVAEVLGLIGVHPSPSQRAIAEATGLDRSTVKKLIDATTD